MYRLRHRLSAKLIWLAAYVIPKGEGREHVLDCRDGVIFYLARTMPSKLSRFEFSNLGRIDDGSGKWIDPKSGTMSESFAASVKLDESLGQWEIVPDDWRPQ